MHSDDGTQHRTIEAIEAAMAVRDVSNGEIARYLGISPSQWSNVKSSHQALALWMLRKIAKRLGTAAPAVGQILAVTGEVLGRDSEEPAIGDPRLVALEVSVGGAQLAREVHAAYADGVVTDEESADLTRRIDQLVAELHRLRARARAG